MTTQTKRILTYSAIVLFLTAFWTMVFSGLILRKELMEDEYPSAVITSPPETAEELIYLEATRAVFDPDTAIRIATCESQLGKYRTNWEGSGAEGLYQFKPATFSAYCQGDIRSDLDQTRCFLELYPKFPHYWECQ